MKGPGEKRLKLSDSGGLSQELVDSLSVEARGLS